MFSACLSFIQQHKKLLMDHQARTGGVEELLDSTSFPAVLELPRYLFQKSLIFTVSILFYFFVALVCFLKMQIALYTLVFSSLMCGPLGVRHFLDLLVLTVLISVGVVVDTLTNLYFIIISLPSQSRQFKSQVLRAYVLLAHKFPNC